MKNLKNLEIAILGTFLILSLLPMNTYAQRSRRSMPVIIENTPITTEIAPRQPFQWGVLNVDFDPTQLGASVSFTVPSEKRLVIEYVSGRTFVDIGDVVAFSVSTTVNGILVHHQLALTPAGPSGGFAKSYTASQSGRLYADSGTEVTVNANNTLGGRATMHASISGYLVDED